MAAKHKAEMPATSSVCQPRHHRVCHRRLTSPRARTTLTCSRVVWVGVLVLFETARLHTKTLLENIGIKK